MNLVYIVVRTGKSAVGIHNIVHRALNQRAVDPPFFAQQERVSFALVHDTHDLCSSLLVDPHFLTS